MEQIITNKLIGALATNEPRGLRMIAATALRHVGPTNEQAARSGAQLPGISATILNIAVNGSGPIRRIARTEIMSARRMAGV